MNIVPHQNLLDLSGKVAIVTGGSLGIGFGISYRLAEAGATVIVVGRRTEEVHKTTDELIANGWKAAPYGADVSNEEQVKGLIDYVGDKFGKIDILVNNAGIFPFVMVADMTTEQFDEVLATNLRGVFLTTKYASNQMKSKSIRGKIINITSIDSLHPSMAGLAVYDASKHGVWGFTKNVALELAKFGITVNNVAPGGILTPGVVSMQSGGKQTTTERFPEPTSMEVPMGRMGVPDDIGKVVLFLASDMSGYMTGTQVVVDGGYLLS